MGVNSGFKFFFNHRLAVSSGIALLILAIFVIASSFTKRSDRDLRSKQANLIMRQIGHQLLLQSGDATSPVLPVTEIREGTFLLEFEETFSFNHDSLVVLAQRLLPKTQFPSGYTLTVHECEDANIVYGFQINNSFPANAVACRGRSQAPGCFSIEITFPDLYETSSDYSSISLVCCGALVFLSITLLVGRFGKSSTPAPALNQHDTVLKQPFAEPPALGKFLFDVKGQRLLLNENVISLTEKECRILELLNNNFGELIPRETLMQQVWINEGVITGRSLDMFVSKLRKKLSSDPELRITNVHGKGYKLEKAVH